MVKIVVLLFVLAVCVRADENSTDSGARQRRAMLFFDDNGSLMKSFSNPYMQMLAHYASLRPEHTNFLEYFFNFLRPLIINTSTAAYMVPVSEDVVQQINNDPVYQNRFTISKRGPEFNPLCAGQRTQIASPKSCNSFLSCWDGWAYELDCPEGLMFSSEGFCDYADMVACKDRTVAIPNPIMPRCKTDFETFRNELNCNEFFVCVNRKPVKFQCPADLAYSQKFGVCDYPALVDCSSSSTFVQPPSAPQPATSTPAPAIPELPAPTTKPPQFPYPSKPGSIVNLPTIPVLPVNQFPGSLTRPVFQADEKPEKPGFQFNPQLSDGNAIFMQNSVYNSHNIATPVAIMSPQDAIRYLKLNNIAEVSSSP